MIKLLKVIAVVLTLAFLYREAGVRYILGRFINGGDDFGRMFRVLTDPGLRDKYVPLVNGEYPKLFYGLLSLLYADPDRVTLEDSRHLKYLYYVGGLRTNDPPGMPILIQHDPKSPFWATIMDLSGNRPYETNGLRVVRMLLSEPWELVKDRFSDAEEYKAFTNRLNITRVADEMKVKQHN
ncbi:MAG: hypothetical protein FWG50_04385 [Kiritimatiellaeota bacterium]|nr:hypothetical protein [Kiritimatiellota bacterium]